MYYRFTGVLKSHLDTLMIETQIQKSEKHAQNMVVRREFILNPIDNRVELGVEEVASLWISHQMVIQYQTLSLENIHQTNILGNQQDMFRYKYVYSNSYALNNN